MLLSPKTHFPAGEIEGWIFDLDNTIYPAASGLFDQVAFRMNAFLEERFNLDADGARAMRSDLFQRYGTTAKGLMEDHGMDPHDFLSYVHEIDLSTVSYDRELDKTLASLPGKKIIFTNGTTRHAMRILEAYQIDHHFSYCYDIIEAEHRPKPDPVIYDDMLKKSGLNANTSVMIEDMAVNLEPASHRGITTVWLDHDLHWSKPGMIAPYIDFIACDLKQFFSKLG